MISSYFVLDPYVNTLLEIGLVFLLIFTPLASGMTQPWAIAVFRLGTALLFVLWMIQAVAWPKTGHRGVNWIFILAIAYFGVNLASLSVSVNLDDSHEEISNLIGYLILFGVAQHVFITTHNAKRLCWIQICVALLLSIYAICQHYGLDFLLWDRPPSDMNRSFATLANANRLAGYLIMIAPLLLAVAMIETSYLIKMGLIAGIGIIYTGLFYTYSRGGWIGFLVSLGCFGLGSAIKRSSWNALRRRGFTLMAAMAMVVVMISLFQRGTRVFDIQSYSTGDESIRYRIDMWKSASEIIRKNPWLGTGTGTYRTAILKEEPEALQRLLAFENLTPIHAHNDYLQIASEVGLSGVIVYLAVLCLIFIQVWKLVSRHPSPSIRYLILGVASGLMAILVQGLAESNLHFIPHATLFWVNLGLVVGLSKSGEGDAIRANCPLMQSQNDRQGEKTRISSFIEAWDLHRLSIAWQVVWIGFIGAGLLFFQSTSYIAHLYQQRGMEARKPGMYDEGVKAFRSALVFKPFAAQFYVELSKIHEAQYRQTAEEEFLQAAIHASDQALACCPYFVPYYVNFARLLLTHRDQLTVQQMNRVTNLLKKAAALNPYFWSTYNNLGVVYYLKQAYQDAERQYQHAIRLKPDSPDVYRNLGMLYQAMGHMGDAEASFKRAIILRPNWAEARIGLGNVYQTQGNWESAARQFRHALVADSTNVVAWYNLAQTLYKQQRWMESGRSFIKAIHYDAYNLNAWNGLGSVYYTTRQYDRAIQCFEQILAQNAAYGIAHQNLGNCYMMKRQWDKAQIHYETALRLGLDSAQIARGLRYVRAKLQGKKH